VIAAGAGPAHYLIPGGIAPAAAVLPLASARWLAS